MELKELIHPLEVLEVVGNTDVEISGIQSDSRKVEKGFLIISKARSGKGLPQSFARKFLLFRMKTYRYPKANRFLSG